MVETDNTRVINALKNLPSYDKSKFVKFRDFKTKLTSFIEIVGISEDKNKQKLAKYACAGDLKQGNQNPFKPSQVQNSGI